MGSGNSVSEKPAKKSWNPFKRIGEKKAENTTVEPKRQAQTTAITSGAKQHPTTGSSGEANGKTSPGASHGKVQQPGKPLEAKNTEEERNENAVAKGVHEHESEDSTAGVGAAVEDHLQPANSIHSTEPESIKEPERDLWEEAWSCDSLSQTDRTRLEAWKKDSWKAEIEDPSKKIQTAPKPSGNAKGIKSPGVGDGSGQNNQAAQGQPPHFVDEVILRTKEKAVKYQRRWGSESEKTIAGTARSVFLSALTMKDLIDAGLHFDPTGYGAAGWAVVSFGLKVRLTCLFPIADSDDKS